MATIAENLKTIKDSTAAIKSAIIDKGGTIEGNLTTYASAIANLPSGGGDVNPTATKNAVTFYDYDGTIRYSYTSEEFLALTEMPPLPTQQGLICQEWNWSYEDAMEYVEEYGVLDVGATYITDDDKTRLYIRIAAEGRMDVPLYFQQTVANGVTIDWGDGSATETLEGTGKVNTTHRYASVGDYMISLDVAEGCSWEFDPSIQILGQQKSFYSCLLTKVEFGDGIDSVESNAFYNYYLINSVTLPRGISSIGSSAFFGAISLKSLVVPRNAELPSSSTFNGASLCSIILPVSSSLYYATFINCKSLTSVVLPYLKSHNGLSGVFQGCISLSSIIIHKSVDKIGSGAFGNCTRMAYYDFSRHEAVPPLTNTNAFTGIPSDCKIIVPDNLYDEWIAATNWSTYASYIIKKSDWDASKNNQ